MDVKKINLKDDNDDFAILPDGILYRKGPTLQVQRSDGDIETWSQDYGVESAIENFESMAHRWKETDFSIRRRKFNAFAAGYLKNVSNGAK